MIPEMTDQHCLELAQSIRTVLTELAERASLVMKENKEIQEALKVLKAIPDVLHNLRASAVADQAATEIPKPPVDGN